MNKKCDLTLQTLKDMVWTDTIHRCRTDKDLMTMLRRDIRAGKYHAYRLITIHERCYGVPDISIDVRGSQSNSGGWAGSSMRQFDPS